MNITREGPTSGQNVFAAPIVLVRRMGNPNACRPHHRIDIGGGVIVTASIANEAVADLKLENGKQAYAVVKASDVMVGVD